MNLYYETSITNSTFNCVKQADKINKKIPNECQNPQRIHLEISVHNDTRPKIKHDGSKY